MGWFVLLPQVWWVHGTDRLQTRARGKICPRDTREVKIPNDQKIGWAFCFVLVAAGPYTFRALQLPDRVKSDSLPPRQADTSTAPGAGASSQVSLASCLFKLTGDDNFFTIKAAHQSASGPLIFSG